MEIDDARICKLLGGDVVEDDGRRVCKIPRRFYKSDKNCSEMSGSVKDDGSCEIPFKFLRRLLQDNKYY